VLQAQRMITGLSRQILFERLPPQTQDLHGFFLSIKPNRDFSRAQRIGARARMDCEAPNKR
jgi:hypothetical protein